MVSTATTVTNTTKGHLCGSCYLLAKVKVVVDNLKHLLQHFVCEWLVSAVDGRFHHFK